jgi:hypothetical protein
MCAAIEGSIKGLPPYIGFGVLDPSSISEADGVLTAKYLADGEIACEARLQQGRAELVEYFAGEEIGRSTGRRLGEAFLLQAYGWSDADHPRLRRLREQYGPQRNIYLDFNSDPPCVTFPAGSILGLQLPLAGSQRAAWDALAGRLAAAGRAAPIRAVSLKQGLVLKLLDGGAVRVEQVDLAYGAAILRHLPEALELLGGSGVIAVEKEHRLTVLPAEQFVEGRLTAYPGDPSRGFLTFSVLAATRAELEQYRLRELFHELSLKLLQAIAGSAPSGDGRE